MTEGTHRPRGLSPHGLLEDTKITHQRLYAAMGEALLFQTNELALLEAADAAFGRFPPLLEPPQSPLLFRLFVHSVGDFPDMHERPRAILRTQQHLFYVTAGAGSAAVADLVRGEAFGFVSPEIAQDRPYLRVNFLENLALTMLTTAREFIPLHAAGVVKNGVSAILCGRAGTGKSTLAFACARRGYQVLSEDGMLVKAPPHQMRLWGVPWQLHLLPDGKRFFPELAAEQPKLQINGEWKLEIELEAFRPHSTTSNAAPGVVLFLERGNAPGTSLTAPISLAQARDRFEIVWPWALEWTAGREEGVVRLLEGKAYRLVMNGSPDEAVDVLDALLERVAR